MDQINSNSLFKMLMLNNKLRKIFFDNLSDNLEWYLENDKSAQNFFINHFKAAIQEDKNFANEVQNTAQKITTSLFEPLLIRNHKPKTRRSSGKKRIIDRDAVEKRRAHILLMLKEAGKKGLNAPEIASRINLNPTTVYNTLTSLKQNKAIKTRQHMYGKHKRVIYFV